jgi:hypothetical protein
MVNSKICHFISLVILLLLFISCNNNSFADEEALLEYLKVEENGYVQRKSINGIDFELMYRPTDLLVKQELGDSISSEKVKALRDIYSKYLYFNLSMSKNNKELLNTIPNNRDHFTSILNQLTFGMGEKVHVFYNKKDTLEIVDYIYPRLYGMSNSTTIMFIYLRKENLTNSEYLFFAIEDLGLNTGEIKFKIPYKLIEQEPKLIFKN